jgi:hypothetical protein
MISAWTKSLKTTEAKQAFYKQFRNSADVLSRLAEMINEDLAGMDASDTSKDDFDTPNWALKQSNRIGQRTYAAKILKLINLDQKDTTK